MSKRGGKNRSRNTTKPRNYNFLQTDVMNNRIYLYYIDLMTKLAMMRFRWIGLPPTCDERFLEWCLVTQGVATIAFPKKQKGIFYSTQAVTDGRLNVYNMPTRWRSYGNNGWNFFVDNSNGVLIYDNSTRYSIYEGIELYANELTHVRITKRLNRLHQQIPYILTGPQEKRQDMMNMFKDIATGEPAIIGVNEMQNIQVNSIDTQVKFLGEELSQEETNIWNQVFTMLGIENTTFKAERMTEDEIRARKSPSMLIAMSSLTERRKAAEKLNERFGKYLTEEIKVEMRQDNESDNWNLLHNITSQIKVVNE